MSIENGYSYYAFISYNHRDEKIAKRLQYRLEHYKLPAVARQEIGEDISLRPVFRYVSDLGVGILREKLKAELEASKYLIVICSPHSAKPNIKGEHWVNDEINHFISLGRKDRIIPIIVDGVVDGGDRECFPPALKEAGVVGVDIQNENRKVVIQKVVAKLLDLKPDILIERYKEEQAKIRRRWFLCILPLLLILGVAGLFVWDACRPVDVQYVNYVDSYGLPEGIFRLSPKDIPGRNIHYRFEYRGIRYGKSIHADSSPWSLIRLFGCQRVLARVIQSNALGYPMAWDHTEYCDRPLIQSFSYAGNKVAEIRYEKPNGENAQPILDKRLVLHDDNGVVNGLLTLRGKDDKSYAFTRSYGTSVSSAGSNAEQTQRSNVAQHQFTRDGAGRIKTIRFLDGNGNPVPDGDNVWGFEYWRDGLGREIEKWHLGRDGKSRCSNRRGIAGKKYVYGGNDLAHGGRNMIRAEYVNEKGLAVLNDQGWMVCIDDFDGHDNNVASHFYDDQGRPMVLKYGYSGYRISFDDRGFEELSEYLDADGKPVMRTEGYSSLRQEFNDWGLVTRCISCDTAGRPVYCRNSGCAEWRVEYDSHGNAIKFRLFDQNGKRVLGSLEGGLSADMVYDNEKRLTSCKFIGIDEQPFCCSSGYAEIRRKYDDRGMCREESYFDEKGMPTLDVNGISRVAYEYDTYGNENKRRFFDRDGKPASNPDGEAGYDIERSPCGAIVGWKNIDQYGKPTLSKDGYAEYRVSLDENFNPWETRYFDCDGNLLMQPDGFAIVRNRYDRNGRVTDKRYFDAEDRPTSGNDNIARTALSYDVNGNETEIRFYDADDKPVYCNDGYAGISKRYDEHGNITNMLYLAIDGKSPATASHGFVQTKFSYDERGRCVREQYSGVDGRPKMVEYGYASWEKEYDDYGNAIRSSVFGTDGTLILNAEYGAAGFVSEYDGNGKETLRKYFGLRGEPILCKSGENAGTAGTRASYDPTGRLLRQSWFDTDGKTAVNSEGVEEDRYEYDALGRLKKRMNCTARGELMTNCHGVAVIEYRYDAKGNEIDRHYSDREGKPAARGGYNVGIRSVFNERNKETVREYYDGNGALTPYDERSAKEGECGYRMTYDDFGRELLRERFGVDGTSQSLVSGYATRKRTYDRGGKLISEIYMDKDNRIMFWHHDKNYAYSESAYDTSGHEISRRYYGVDGKPCKSTGELFGWEKERDLNGRVKCIHWLDAKGRRTPIDGGTVTGALIVYDVNGRMKERWWIDRDGKRTKHRDGEFAVRYEYDVHGKCSREEYVDMDGQLVEERESRCSGWEKTFDANGNEVAWRMYGKDRNSVNGKDGWATRTNEYDQCGNCIRTRLYDENDRPLIADLENGAYSTVRVYDDNGRVVSLRFMGKDGKPGLNKDGIAGWNEVYSRDGLTNRMEYVDLQGNPCSDGNGVFGRLIQYDGYKRQERVEQLGAQGELVLGGQGVAAGVHMLYDPAGNEVMREYYGVDRKLFMTKFKYAKFEKTFDARKNCTSEIYYDENGQMIMWHTQERYAYSKSTFDVNGNETSRRYYGADNKPCAVRGELFGWNKTYNDDGRVLEIYWVDSKGNVVLSEDNVAGQRFLYDGEGRIVERKWLDVDGRATRHKDGNGGWRSSYDSRGNEIRREFIDVDGRVMKIGKSGLAGWVRTFDVNGNVLYLRNIGVKGEYVMNDDGWSAVNRKFDSSGKCVDVKFYDVEDRQIEMVNVVIISEIVKDSMAEKSDVHVGDVLCCFGKYDIHSPGEFDSLREAIEKARMTEKTLCFMRNVDGLFKKIVVSFPVGQMGIGFGDNCIPAKRYAQILKMLDEDSTPKK